MSVELEPAELGFKRPFAHEVSQTLRLHNPNPEPVAFKVKTTAPKQYCVRPNSGRIDPHTAVEVQVLLQAMKEDPPPDARCRDKFLVQSVLIPADSSATTVSQIWAHVEQTAKADIQEKKIRVSFLPADGQREVNGEASPPPPAYESMTTPQKSPTAAAAVTPSEGKSSRGAGEEDGAPATTTAGVVASAAAAVGSSVGMTVSREDLQRQLEAANAKVQALQEQVTEGLRQRKIVGSAAEEKKMKGNIQQQQAQPVGGVPVQIVAVLCLICFLIAYFFF